MADKLRYYFYRLINPVVKILWEVFIVNRTLRRRIKGGFCQKFLTPYIKDVEKKQIKPEGKKEPYRIWQYWETGLDTAPDIVKACIKSVDRYKGDIEHVVLDFESIKNYVEIPQYIYDLKEKGIIKAAHFSDILRTYLLYYHGGCWIDATVLMTSPFPDFVRNSKLFVFSNNKDEDPDKLNMTNYLMSSNGDSVIIAKMKCFLDEYFKSTPYILNYFMNLHAFTILTSSSEENKEEWENMHKFSYLTVQQMQSELLDTFSEKRFNELSEMSAFHKLSYKWKVITKKKNFSLTNTLYQHIIDEYVDNISGIPTKKAGLFQNFKSAFACAFSFQNIDEHYVLKLFGIKFCKKYKYNIEIKPVIEKGILENKRKTKLIVSLTTFPQRIDTVYKTISTLLNQTLKPDEIILTLAESQFPDKKLPQSLIILEKYGLTINWYKEDIKSFKKLVPALEKYPDDIIVTADDDIFYPKNWLENLYGLYLKNPKCACANRAFMVKNKKDRFYMTSRSYTFNDTYLPRYRNEFMTGYGTLFPPHSLSEKVFDRETFMKEIPTNDDIWFWAMAVLNGTKIIVNPEGFKLHLIENKEVQEYSLKNMNRNDTTVGTSGRDGVNKMCDMFEDVRGKLLKEKQRAL